MISEVFSNAIIQIHIALEHYQSQYLNSAATDYVMFICCFEHIFNFWLDFWSEEHKLIATEECSL